mmetsp:Transcript_26859/g.52588  ORF Transcript_26859/g.52588 Transcript_26859/m.52588 type:complete len:232 (-) Transcript_26859:47-742(-)
MTLELFFIFIFWRLKVRRCQAWIVLFPFFGFFFHRCRLEVPLIRRLESTGSAQATLSVRTFLFQTVRCPTVIHLPCPRRNELALSVGFIVGHFVVTPGPSFRLSASLWWWSIFVQNRRPSWRIPIIRTTALAHCCCVQAADASSRPSFRSRCCQQCGTSCTEPTSHIVLPRLPWVGLRTSAGAQRSLHHRFSKTTCRHHQPVTPLAVFRTVRHCRLAQTCLHTAWHRPLQT